ncbi:23.6 kDa heat shock protein- mitochondrial [Striga hermonthica]|uniref:23.6 kDa heat shock protein- mitochondrial n=1 Tax=Striga hermonthica TaxID=68872 RepID=A0A9N7R9M9_STRHE|nr:23.6 kDa heat shock protein- mitochondrial [Striga hermonthica]
MASSLVLKRLVRVAPNLLRRSAVARPSASRLFNTNAVRESGGDDDDRPAEHRVLSTFSDIFCQYLERSSLNIIMKLDELLKSPPRSTTVLRNWDARETADWIQLRMDMPGLGKEDIKVSVEHNTVTIEGKKKKECDEDEEDGGGRRRCTYNKVIDLPAGMYNTSEIKAEMKKGVLKVFLPKIKQMSGVFYVNIG